MQFHGSWTAPIPVWEKDVSRAGLAIGNKMG